MAKNAKVAKSPQIRLQGVSRGFRWFQVSNSMGSDDSGDLRAGTLRVRGARALSYLVYIIYIGYIIQHNDINDKIVSLNTRKRFHT